MKYCIRELRTDSPQATTLIGIGIPVAKQKIMCLEMAAQIAIIRPELHGCQVRTSNFSCPPTSTSPPAYILPFLPFWLPCIPLPVPAPLPADLPVFSLCCWPEIPALGKEEAGLKQWRRQDRQRNLSSPASAMIDSWQIVESVAGQAGKARQSSAHHQVMAHPRQRWQLWEALFGVAAELEEVQGCGLCWKCSWRTGLQAPARGGDEPSANRAYLQALYSFDPALLLQSLANGQWLPMHVQVFQRLPGLAGLACSHCQMKLHCPATLAACVPGVVDKPLVPRPVAGGRKSQKVNWDGSRGRQWRTTGEISRWGELKQRLFGKVGKM